MKKLFLAFLATGFTQVAGFASGVLLARYLEPSTRGEVAQIIAWFSFFASILLCGINDSVTYHRSRNGDEGAEAMSAALILSLPLIALSMLSCIGVILIVFSKLSTPSLAAAWLFLLFPALYQWQQIFNSYFQSGNNAIIWTAIRVVPATVYIGGLGLAIISGYADPVHFIASNLASLIVMLLTCCTIFWLSGDRLTRPSFDMLHRVFKFGFATVVQRIAFACRDVLDRIALPFFVTSAALGHYVVASSTAYLIYVAGITIDLVGFPAMARAKTDEDRRRIAEFLIAITFCGLVILVFGLIMICEPVVYLLFGKQYAASASLVPWFLIAGSAQALRIVIGSAFKSFNLSRATVRFELIGALIMIALLFGAGPRLGIFAGVLAHLLSSLVSLCMALYTAIVVLKLSPRHIFLPRSADLVRVLKDVKATFRPNTT